MTTPVTVIGGYLGAGKTTLINRMLRHADGQRIAVLVNEFGALSIDEDLILAQDGDVISIAGGCICCAFGDNLMGAITDMTARTPRPDHIVIEASGVAIPGSIAATLSLVAGVSFAGTVVLADVETVEARARDKYLSDTILRQLDGADLVVLTKTDLVDSADIARVEDWLNALHGSARILHAPNGTEINALLLGVIADPAVADTGPPRDHSAAYEALAFQQTAPTEAAILAERLAHPDLGLIRAKGFARQPDGDMREIQIAGARWQVTAVAPDTPGNLVCIALRPWPAKARCIEIMAGHGYAPVAQSR
ncbi:CobW family GTP-binding protein [Pseudaestuariivita atlantica]|uniref:CobW family GTP-binding protein n=1 Tax=Pseudaestuariivita atlantica TaxID=1317121 RepID=UPI00067E5E5B|nr:GTP-binding protein [Pseudaestuariivita atlantica]